MLKSLLLPTLAGLVLSSCGREQKDSGVKNVFEADNRVPMSQTTGIYTAIGMVRKSNAFCTGSLVWKNLVLTNAHCVLNGGVVVLPSALTFTAGEGTTNRQVFNVSEIWPGTTDPQANRSEDWAILKLTQNTNRAYFGFKSAQNLNPLPLLLTLAGYSGDFYQTHGKAGIDAGCRIRGDESNYFLHDCDMMGGASGSPIYATTSQGHFIVAINAAHRTCNGSQCANGIGYSNGHANIAVKTAAFSQMLTNIRGDNP